MERTITEHEIKTEYNLIREITRKYVTVDGVEYGPNTHRAPQHVPGTLNGGYLHKLTSMKDLIS